MSLPRLSVPMALLLYVGLLFGLRTFGVSGGSIDDAEQLLYSQSWAFAYSAHNPPGPTWLARALQLLAGPSLFSVLLPKFCWLWLAGVAFHACARRVLETPERAALATCWLAGIYYIAWECLLNYSHSVQVLAVSMLITLQALRMRESRSSLDYLLLGALVALGLVSKFNFAVLLLAMVIASLRVPAYRAVVLDRRLALGALLALALLAPVLLAQWALLNQQAAATTAKFAIAKAWSLPIALHGALSAVTALASWLAPLLLFVAVVVPRALLPGQLAREAPGVDTAPDVARRREARLADERWLRWMGGAMLFIVMALVVGSRAAQARTHYFQVAVPLVLWLALRVDLLGASRKRWRVIAGLSLFLGVLAPLLLAVELSGLANITGKSRLTVPYRGLAEALKASGFHAGIVIAEDWPHALSGNLRPYLADSSFFSLAHTDYVPAVPPAGAQCLLVWQSGEVPAELDTAPEAIKAVVTAEGAEAGLRYGRLSLRTRGRAGTSIGIGWALWPGAGRCVELMPRSGTAPSE